MVHVGPICKFVWREPVQARVWAVLVIVVPPCFNDVLSVAVTGEDVLVQALVA